MININELTNKDIGRNVTYHREYCGREYGTLTSWNSKYVFVRFKGPNGEACEPDDVSFSNVTDAGAETTETYSRNNEEPGNDQCADNQ